VSQNGSGRVGCWATHIALVGRLRSRDFRIRVTPNGERTSPANFNEAARSRWRNVACVHVPMDVVNRRTDNESMSSIQLHCRTNPKCALELPGFYGLIMGPSSQNGAGSSGMVSGSGEVRLGTPGFSGGIIMGRSSQNGAGCAGMVSGGFPA
jgi:hypothetical protein